MEAVVDHKERFDEVDSPLTKKAVEISDDEPNEVGFVNFGFLPEAPQNEDTEIVSQDVIPVIRIPDYNLEGEWAGLSVSIKKKQQTIWKNIMVNRRAYEEQCSFHTTGNSFWKGEIIPFDLVLETKVDRKVNLHKQHTHQKYKNAIDYVDCHLMRIEPKNLHDFLSGSADTISRQLNGEVRPREDTISPFFQNQGAQEEENKTNNGNDISNGSGNIKAHEQGIPNAIYLDDDKIGCVKLIKLDNETRRIWFAWLAVMDTTKQRSNTKSPPATKPKASKSASGSPKDENNNDGDENQENTDKGEGVVFNNPRARGISRTSSGSFFGSMSRRLSESVVSQSETSSLESPNKDGSPSDEVKKGKKSRKKSVTIREPGSTSASPSPSKDDRDYEEIESVMAPWAKEASASASDLNSPSHLSGSRTATSIGTEHKSDTCNICCNKQIDCVIIPCGHYALCLDCGLHLDHCPWDRQKIDKLQPIYRV